MTRIAAWLFLAAVGLGLAAALAMAVRMPPDSGRHRQTKAEKQPAQAQSASLDASAKDTKAPAGNGLERLDPRAPLSGLAAPSPPPPPPDPDTLPKRWQLLHRPVATAAGILEAGGMTLVLPGIDVVSADETCTSPSGENWPCGMAARTAFRAYLRGRALNCHLPDAPSDEDIATECLLQGEDPALWLVSQGWARAKPDGPFGLQAEAAELARLGIFGQPPR